MSIFENVMRKSAYVPLSPAAQQAAAPQPAEAPAQGGMPPMPPMQDPGMMPPQDPNMLPPQHGEAPMPANDAGMGAPAPSGMTPIQTVPGPNGEPIDPETGFIVLDPQQGIEQDPLTGIFYNKMLNEFATPDGQPLPPDQAMQMITQAQQQGAMPADPNMMPPQGQAPMPPMQDPGMMQAPPMQQMASAEYPAAQQPAPPMPPMGGELNEAAGMQVDPNTGLPIDPNSGMLIDPNSGAMIDPATMQQVPAGSGAAQLMSDMPGLQEFMTATAKQLEAQDKSITRIIHDMNGSRTDLQGLRREVQKNNDNCDVVLQRMDNLLQLAEQLMSRVGGVQPIQAPGVGAAQ